MALKTAAQSFAKGASEQITTWTPTKFSNCIFNTSSGVFTIPYEGRYMITLTANLYSRVQGDTATLSIRGNGNNVVYAQTVYTTPGAGFNLVTVSTPEPVLLPKDTTITGYMFVSTSLGIGLRDPTRLEITIV